MNGLIIGFEDRHLKHDVQLFSSFSSFIKNSINFKPPIHNGNPLLYNPRPTASPKARAHPTTPDVIPPSHSHDMIPLIYIVLPLYLAGGGAGFIQGSYPRGLSCNWTNI